MKYSLNTYTPNKTVPNSIHRFEQVSIIFELFVVCHVLFHNKLQ